MKPEQTASVLSLTCVAVLPPFQVQEMLPQGVLTAWGNRGKLWPQGSSLRVKFLDGGAKEKLLAMEQFKVLDDLCGLAVKEVRSGRSEIRVSFRRNSGHWSYVGIDNLSISQLHQTMNLGLSSLDSKKEWSRVAKHEFLHAVGFNHEHQHPRGTIPWDVEAVYEFYGDTQGWSRAEIDAQVLRRSTSKNIFGSGPDPKSIMMYPIPKELLLDSKYAVGWNTDLSALDIQTLKRVYP